MQSHSFGQRVRARRLEMNLTQAQLGELVGVSQVSIKKIEAGGRTRHGRKIAEVLETTLATLETGIGEKPSGITNEAAAHDRKYEWPFDEQSRRRFYSLSVKSRKEVENYFLVALATVEAKSAKKPTKTPAADAA